MYFCDCLRNVGLRNHKTVKIATCQTHIETPIVNVIQQCRRLIITTDMICTPRTLLKSSTPWLRLPRAFPSAIPCVQIKQINYSRYIQRCLFFPIFLLRWALKQEGRSASLRWCTGLPFFRIGLVYAGISIGIDSISAVGTELLWKYAEIAR